MKTCKRTRDFGIDPIEETPLFRDAKKADEKQATPEPVTPQSTCIEHGPGGTIRLSRQIYVF